MTNLEPGVYRHSKSGNLYEYLFASKHADTLDDLANYKALYDNPVSEYWSRSMDEFAGAVLLDGDTVPVPRFERTGPRIPPPAQLMAAAIDWMVHRRVLSSRSPAGDARLSYGQPYTEAEALAILQRGGVIQ